MEGGVRFDAVELEYGCHASGRLPIPAKEAPLVLAGPNGAGKSTLLEGIVRTIFGFNRRLQSDSDHLEARRPWRSGECVGRVALTDREGRAWEIRRDFEASEVEVRPLGDDGQIWRGDGNPAATNAEATEYRRRLEELLGFSDRSTYEATACIQQGQLSGTRLSEDLLRVAAGGYGDVDEAQERLKDGYRRVTRRPLEPGARAATKDRELEGVQGRIAELRSDLRRAEDAEERRGPLLRELEETKARRIVLQREMDRLEEARRPLAARRQSELERDAARGRQQALSGSLARLRDARERWRTAEGDWREVEAGPLYPDDFGERLAALELLWAHESSQEADRAELERTTARLEVPEWMRRGAPVGAGVAALGLLLAIFGPTLLGVVLLAGGAAAGVLLHSRRRDLEAEIRRRKQALAEAEAELRSVRAQIARKREGVPDGESITAATAPERRHAFERQRERAEARTESLRELGREVAEAERLLGNGDAAADGEESGAAASGDDAAALGARAEALAEALRAGVEAARDAAARCELALSQAVSPSLPEGVNPDLAAVERAYRERRLEDGRLSERLRDLDRRLLEEGSGVESPVALRDRLAGLEERRAELELSAEAYRAAHALLREAYAEFRERDQERLLSRISDRLLELSGGDLGPLEAAGPLSEARVRVGGRSCALASPPLSYGEYHTVLLAIRLGATDFLAAGGVRPPLIVDEPFAFLDEERARHLWRLLSRVSRERQVILSTQDMPMLDRLGVSPDVELERGGRLRGEGPTRAPGSRARAGGPEPGPASLRRRPAAATRAERASPDVAADAGRREEPPAAPAEARRPVAEPATVAIRAARASGAEPSDTEGAPRQRPPNGRHVGASPPANDHLAPPQEGERLPGKPPPPPKPSAPREVTGDLFTDQPL